MPSPGGRPNSNSFTMRSNAAVMSTDGNAIDKPAASATSHAVRSSSVGSTHAMPGMPPYCEAGISCRSS
eukprot:504846-Lingulodinium_polyedra.AAC.1